MKPINNYIQESILDTDEKIHQQAKHELIKQIMSQIALGCKFQDDYIIDDDNRVHIYGCCHELIINEQLQGEVRFAEIEPSTRCICRVLSMKNIREILPLNLGKYGYTGFTLTYNVKEDINGGDLPMFVNGSIMFSRGGNLDIRVMPNCTGGISINEKGFKNVKYPPGFPESVTEIKINKKN